MDRRTIRKLIRFALKRCECPELTKRGKIKLEFVEGWTTTLGEAEWFPACSKHDGYGVIKLSIAGWAELDEGDQTELILHETCHLICDFKFPRDKSLHGENWKSFMMCVGIPSPRAVI